MVPAALGPRLGGETQHVIRAVREGDWSPDGDTVVAGGHRLEPGEFVLTMVADGDRPSTALTGGAGVVVLNVDLTPELEAEGQARDLIRMIQQARRDADLAVSDRIDLRIVADGGWAEVVCTHEALIAAETLATSLEVDDSGTDTPQITVRVSS